MDFDETQEYLLALGNEVSAMKLGLESIRTLLTALGDPQNNYLKVQVAGTNGKGSVCAFLDSICRTAGINTGLYTSPHLVSITERIRLNGDDISGEKFATLSTHVRETSERLVAADALPAIPTFFEQVTAIALLAFAEARVELAMLETGLGGRLDATTAANAEIAAITRIDLDHQQYLGNTIEEIAAEKAAIIHSGSSVVIGEQLPEALEVLLERGRDVEVEPIIAGGNAIVMAGTRLGLRGQHQKENAEIAVALAQALQGPFVITEQNIAEGLANAHHPGRLEYQGKYLFDGAHNLGGAKALAAYLNEFDQRPITLLFGAMNDKPVDEILKVIVGRAERIVLTQLSNDRSYAYDDLLEAMPLDTTKEKTFVTDTVKDAIDIAQSTTPGDGIILVTGSLYLVGEVKKLLSEDPQFEIRDRKSRI